MTRTCADDNQVAVLPPSGNRIQGREAGRYSGETVGLLDPLQTLHGHVYSLAKVHVTAAHVALNGVEYLGL